MEMDNDTFSLYRIKTKEVGESMAYLQKLSSALIFSLVFSSYSYSYIFIDVDECTLPSGRGMRIAAFDTEAQKFKYVSYHTSPDPQQEGWLVQDRWGILYGHSGNVSLPDKFDLRNFIIRARGNFVGNKIGASVTTDGKHLLRHKLGGIKQTQEPADRIYSKLQGFSTAPKGNLQVIINGIVGTEEQIPGNKDVRGKEKGRLGELATELTFLSFGYFKLPSQNGSNHGLDGVYVDNIGKPLHLFLTESKYRNESKTAEAYMDDELNEEEICRKTEIAHPETQSTIKSFLEHKPFGIHKLIHRMKRGASQICVRAFDQRSYRGFRLKNPISPLSEEDTMAILEDMLNKMRITLQTPQEISGEHRTLEGRAKIKLNHFLDNDSRELLEYELRALSPKEIKAIKDKLKEVPEDRRQMVFDVTFRSILGHAGNSSHILEREILSTIGSIFQSLAALPIEQFSHVYPIADIIFGSDYFDVDSDHFELEDRLSLFHSFLNSTHGHLLDTENRGDLLSVYHMIYDSLRAMGIEPEETQASIYLASFVEAFRNLDDNELKDLCHTIADIYDSEEYSELEGSHGCEDWELLAEQLRGLNAEQRKTLSNFLSWLPRTFNFGPADAVEVFKKESWLEKINRLESFEDVGTLAEQAFQIHDDQDNQLECLELIITCLIDKVPPNKIMKRIREI